MQSLDPATLPPFSQSLFKDTSEHPDYIESRWSSVSFHECVMELLRVDDELMIYISTGLTMNS